MDTKAAMAGDRSRIRASQANRREDEETRELRPPSRRGAVDAPSSPEDDDEPGDYGPGRPIDPRLRASLEASFRQDFSRVRVHDDAEAQAQTRARGAKAFAFGEHVVFGSGRYQPDRAEGERLLAHELAHVVQQRSAPQNPARTTGATEPVAERSADRAALLASLGIPVGDLGIASRVGPQHEDQAKSAPADEDLGWVWNALIRVLVAPVTLISQPAGAIMSAVCRGMISQLKKGWDEKRKEQFKERLREIVRHPLKFAASFLWGLVKGILSPVTGLFSLIGLLFKLPGFAADLIEKTWSERDRLLERVTSIGTALAELGNSSKIALAQSWAEFRQSQTNPADLIRKLGGILDMIAEKANQVGMEIGQKAADQLLSVLDKPADDIGDELGESVGEIAVNVALFIFGAGVGEAVAQVATWLGRLGEFLGAAGRVGRALAPIINGLVRGLEVVTGVLVGIERVMDKAMSLVLKPLAPVVKRLGKVVEETQGFLRELLGISEREATTATRAARNLTREAPHVPSPERPMHAPEAPHQIPPKSGGEFAPHQSPTPGPEPTHQLPPKPAGESTANASPTPAPEPTHQVPSKPANESTAHTSPTRVPKSAHPSPAPQPSEPPRPTTPAPKRSPAKQQPTSARPIEERVTFGALDEHGRATYALGEVHPADLRTGSVTGATYPPGFERGELSTPKWRSELPAEGPVDPRYRAQRGHLVGDLFGGSGTDPRNLAWMHERINLSTFKTEFENPVRAALERGESVKFSIEPKYRPGEAAPHAIEVWASSTSGKTIVPAKTILTPGLSDVPLPAVGQ